MFPRSVCSVAPATGNVKQKNFCKLSPLDTRGFLKSGPHLPRACIQLSRKASVGTWCAEEGTSKFTGRPGSRGARGRDPFSREPYAGSHLGHPFPSVLPRQHSTTLPRGRSWERLRGLCSLTKLQFSRPHPQGSQVNSSERRFSAGREGGNGWRRQRVSPSSSRGTSAASGGVGRWEPPGGAPRFPRALRTPLGLQDPKRRLRPSPGLLTDSADTQATKPKVSRIQARRIFPREPAAPCRRLQPG